MVGLGVDKCHITNKGFIVEPLTLSYTPFAIFFFFGSGFSLILLKIDFTN
jgi:hypothetical protein